MVHLGKLQRKAYLHYQKKHKLRAKIISRYIRLVYSCDISYRADVHPSVNFSHMGLGTVVGSGAVIGEGSKVLQHVTIGGRGDHRGPNGESMPVIGKNVLIGAGACIMGPITIGDNASIGANAVVLHDVPAGATVVGIPARQVK